MNTRIYESNADEASAKVIMGMEWKRETVQPKVVRDMLQQTQFRPSFKAGQHISVDTTLIAASRYAIEKLSDQNKMLAEALEDLRVWAYDTMAAMGKTVPLELAADVEAALAAVRGEK